MYDMYNITDSQCMLADSCIIITFHLSSPKSTTKSFTFSTSFLHSSHPSSRPS